MNFQTNSVMMSESNQVTSLLNVILSSSDYVNKNNGPLTNQAIKQRGLK